MSVALSIAQHNRGENKIGMARGGQGYIMELDGSKSKSKPDWAGIQEEKLCTVPIGGKMRMVRFNILPGETKLSTKWKSRDFMDNPQDSDVRLPVRQILTYCVLAKTRYRYLLT